MENNSQKINKDNNQTNDSLSQNSSSKYETSKELLIKLLKEKLDTRLLKLEKRHKNHFTTMRSTTEEIKFITDWSINANKQIRDKLKKDKEKQQAKSNINKPKLLNSKSSYLKTKTPLRIKSTKSLIIENTKIEMSRNKQSNKSLINSKISKTLGNRTKSFSILTRKKNNNNKTINNLNVVDNNTLRRPSLVSNKSNKSNKTATISKTPKYKKNNIKVPNKTVTPVRRKTPFKKKNNAVLEKKENNINNIKNISNNAVKDNISVNNKSEISKKNEENKGISEINMNKMESALQKDDLLNNNDPLLISPITDFDFEPNGKISSTNTINSDICELEKIKKFNYNLTKIFNDKLYKIISDYLSIHDLIQFKNISQYFHKLFKIYIITKLKKEKEYFINKKTNLNIDKNNLPKNLSFNDFTLSKGSIKAISLLNEPHLNYLFFEESPADNDRIIIYRIFFQLINHPYKYIPIDKKEEFWKKCQSYFSNDMNGKTGDLLQKTVDNKNINIEGDNLYKIYKLANNNLKKIYPSYYSKSCGTTGLFTFFIKDILDFVGISNDQKIQSKAYWTYIKIIGSIEDKLKHLDT